LRIWGFGNQNFLGLYSPSSSFVALQLVPHGPHGLQVPGEAALDQVLRNEVPVTLLRFVLGQIRFGGHSFRPYFDDPARLIARRVRSHGGEVPVPFVLLYQGIQHVRLQLTARDYPSRPSDDNRVVELVRAAGVPLRIEIHLQVGQRHIHLEADPGVTGQVVELLPLGRAVEVHAPFVKDEVEGGDVRVSFCVHSGQSPDVRGRQDPDHLLRIFDLAMFSSHGLLIGTRFFVP